MLTTLTISAAVLFVCCFCALLQDGNEQLDRALADADWPRPNLRLIDCEPVFDVEAHGGVS